MCLVSDAITQPAQEERSRYPAAYASGPDGALLGRQFLLLLAKAHLASEATPARVGPTAIRGQSSTGEHDARLPSVAEDGAEVPPGALTPSRARAHWADEKVQSFQLCRVSNFSSLRGRCDLLSL